jgi:hypothetical protein
VQRLKNTLSLSKLNLAHANGPDGPRKDTETGAPADFSGRVADCPASWPGRSTDNRVKKFILLFYKRLCILKNEALLALMQMQQFMLYEALSFTPIKFIDHS